MVPLMIAHIRRALLGHYSFSRLCLAKMNQDCWLEATAIDECITPHLMVGDVSDAGDFT